MPGRLLIADSVAGERILLKARLASHAYQISQAATSQEVLDQARAEQPGLILLPQWMGAVDGVDLFRKLRSDPRTRGIPIILRLERADVRARLRALEAGVDAVIDMSAEPALLGARIRNLLRRHASDAELRSVASANSPGFAEPMQGFLPGGNVVLITPSALDGAAMRQALAAHIRDRIRAVPAEAALAMIGSGPAPDAIVMMDCPEAPGWALQMISELRCRADTMRSAILMVQEQPSVKQAATALDIGVDDLIDTGFEVEELALRLRRELAHKRCADRFRDALRIELKMAMLDPLTGLFNRRFAMTKLSSYASDAIQDGSQFAVLVIDLDRFKSINDRYGHPAGDAVLIEVADRMRQCLRQNDLLARIGGEEFLAVVRGCTLASATRAADRIRQRIGGTPIALPGSAGVVAVTASIGLRMSTGSRPLGSEQMLNDADQALYVAKANGRNKVRVSHDAA